MLTSKDQWFLGAPPRIKVPGVEGAYVHVGTGIHSTVVFLGFEDTSAPGGISCIGTGFFQLYDEAAYLITVRHVAADLDGGPFVVRLNKRNGEAGLLHVDARWTFHPDRLVDLAAMPLRLTRAEFSAQYLPQERIMTRKLLEANHVDVGDVCYTVGLFRFIYGNKRNFPLVHTGNIALMAPDGEKIPIWDEKASKIENIEGHLIEGRAIKGASGSPVFVRPSFPVKELEIDGAAGKIMPGLYNWQLKLLGVFQGAWFLPPDAITAAGYKTKPADVVPVGVGIVIPAEKIVELLEVDALKVERKKAPHSAARMASVSDEISAPPATDENPNHREDFTRLLGAAARKPPQED